MSKWGNATVRVRIWDTEDGERVFIRNPAGDVRPLGAAEFLLCPPDVEMDPPHDDEEEADA